MLLAAATSLLLSVFLGPWFIQKLTQWKIGDIIRKEEAPLLGQLHAKKENTPTMGGMLILFSMLISLLLWMDLRNVFTLLLFVTTLFLGGVGFYDDWAKIRWKNGKGISAKTKFCLQSFLALFIALYMLYPPVSEAIHIGKWWAPPQVKEMVSLEIKKEGGKIETLSLQEYASRVYIPFFKGPVWIASGFGLLLLALFFVIVINGSSNGVNLSDGLDGLAAGLLIIVAGTFALFAFLSNHVVIARYLHILYIEGSGEIAVYLLAFVGASLGFLWYNGYPAEIFMGDTGSLPLGGILGVAAILLRREFLLALVGGIFVAEALSVILQVISWRYRKKRIFLCAPLHHHFEYRGWHEMKVVLRFWIIGVLLAIIGLVSLKFQ